MYVDTAVMREADRVSGLMKANPQPLRTNVRYTRANPPLTLSFSPFAAPAAVPFLTSSRRKPLADIEGDAFSSFLETDPLGQRLNSRRARASELPEENDRRRRLNRVRVSRVISSDA